jgi:uncharacterized protein YktB (UPF0637 family)
MVFPGFNPEDFRVFEVDGLDQRMAALREQIKPKLDWLGAHFCPMLSVLTGQEMYYHVAKHARRTVHPPMNTWVAWSVNKRGYKMAPHFELGMWNSHLFIWFAIIYESSVKSAYAQELLDNVEEIQKIIPEYFLWSWDHTQIEAYPQYTLHREDLVAALKRVRDVKKAELLCGITVDRNDPILHKPELLHKIEETLQTLMPLYKML